MEQLQTALLRLYGRSLVAPSLKREEGQTFVEYALILSLIAILMAAVLGLLRGKIASLYSHVANSLP
jgi:Flp pilus assembly pilin Flp